MNSPAFDDERDEYTAPGHTEPLRLRSDTRAVKMCEHSFELQSMRNTIEHLRAENDNLREELRSAREMLELANDGD